MLQIMFKSTLVQSALEYMNNTFKLKQLHITRAFGDEHHGNIAASTAIFLSLCILGSGGSDGAGVFSSGADGTEVFSSAADVAGGETSLSSIGDSIFSFSSASGFDNPTFSLSNLSFSNIIFFISALVMRAAAGLGVDRVTALNDAADKNNARSRREMLVDFFSDVSNFCCSLIFTCIIK
ncbi:hypothetical protein Hanom_Chr17g01563211 [Helianthus anomalus]